MSKNVASSPRLALILGLALALLGGLVVSCLAAQLVLPDLVLAPLLERRVIDGAVRGAGATAVVAIKWTWALATIGSGLAMYAYGRYVMGRQRGLLAAVDLGVLSSPSEGCPPMVAATAAKAARVPVFSAAKR